MNTDQIISVANQPCSVVVPIWEDWLNQSGLFVLRTFDLQETHPPVSPCSCSYHGTEKCDCQMVFLMVYSQDDAPVSLLAHGNNGHTWLSFTVLAGDNNPLEAHIRELFELKVNF